MMSLDVPQHRPQPALQVVFDVGDQVLHTVGQHLLPGRGRRQQTRGPVSARTSSSATTCSAFAGSVSTACSAWICWPIWSATNSTSRRGRGSGLRVGRPDHPAAQEFDQLGVAGFLGQRSDRAGTPAAGTTTPAITGRSSPARSQVPLVDLDDPPPFRVQVGLGDHARRARAALQRLPQEVQFGLGQFLRGVGDEQHPVGLVERAEGDDAVRGVQAADPGCVDQAEPGPQEPAGQPDLDRTQARAGCRDCRSRRPIRATRLDRHRLGQRLAVLAGRLEIGGGAGGVAVADERRDDGDLVGVDRADRGLQQGVDHGALAALELADDGHADRPLVQPGPGTVQRLGQIAAVPGDGQFAAPVQAGQRLVDQSLLRSELVRQSWRRSPGGGRPGARVASGTSGGRAGCGAGWTAGRAGAAAGSG